MHHAVVKRTTAALLVDHLHLDKHHISTVCFHAFRILDGCQFQLKGVARCLYLIRRAITAFGLDDTWFKLHIPKSEEPPERALTLAQRLAVDKEFHFICSGDHIDRLHDVSSCRSAIPVIPMAHNIGPFPFRRHPAVPHHLMGIESILRNAHRIGHATRAVVGFATMMGIGVAEHYFHATTIDTLSCSRTLHPVFVPTLHHATGQTVHVVVVVESRCATIERPVALLMVGIGIFVPIFAQTFITIVLHRPHGLRGTLVDIEHLATVFGLRTVEHFPGADGPSATGVILVANGFHFLHVLFRDTEVATLVKDDTRIIPIVNNCISHQLGALLPAGTVDIFLCITGRHRLEQAHTVARLNVLFPGTDVHPAYHIAARLHHQRIRVVAQPGWNTDTHAGPFVRSALGITMHHQTTVVQIEFAVAERCLTEAGAGDDAVESPLYGPRGGFNSFVGRGGYSVPLGGRRGG